MSAARGKIVLDSPCVCEKNTPCAWRTSFISLCLDFLTHRKSVGNLSRSKAGSHTVYVCVCDGSVCVCVYADIYTCVYMWICICVHTCVCWICIHVCICGHVHVCMDMYTCVDLYMCVYVHMCGYMCVYDVYVCAHV